MTARGPRGARRSGPLTFVVTVVAFGGAVHPTAIAAQWPQGAPGKVWAKTAIFLQQTDLRFGPEGDKQPWLGNGESDARALFTDVIVGITPRLDFWAQIPFFDLRFSSVADDLQSVGFGDIRGWFRYNVFNSGGTPISIRVGAKAPVGDSPLDAQIIPVGEGQWDLEFIGEIGHSFWPFPAYAELWLGYRARFENTDTARDPGGEYLYLAEVGGNPTPATFLKATLDGFVGKKFIVEGFLTNTSREITTVSLGAAVRVSRFWPEINVRIPVAGQEFPAGVQYAFGVSTQLR